MGSIIGHKIDYYGVGALRGQSRTYPAKINPSTPPGKEISIFLSGAWNLYLREMTLVTDVAVLTN